MTGRFAAALEAKRLVITHLGSGQQYNQPLVWRKTATGGQSGESTFAIPPGAKLGVYEVELRGGERSRSFTTGQFRVEEFRLPVLEGRITPSDKKALVNARVVPVDVQVNYVSGGGANSLPVRVSALVRNKQLNYDDFSEFSFQSPSDQGQATAGGEEDSSTDARVVLDKLPLALDNNGAG